MKTVRKDSLYTFTIIVCLLFATVSCGKDDNDIGSHEYMGTWYRYQLNSSASQLLFTVWYIGENQVKIVLYTVDGKNLNLSSGTISKVKKEYEVIPFSVSGNIVNISDGSEHKSFKYSVIENQLVLTDTSNGNLYSVLRITSEVQAVVDNLEKISM